MFATYPAGMGPSARHITQPALAARVQALPSPATVTADLRIRVYRRLDHGQRGSPPAESTEPEEGC